MATLAVRSTHNQPQTGIGRFFHAEETPYGLALVRILLPVALLFAMVPRWFFARELYSADGATAPLAVGYGFPSLLPEFSGTVVVGLHSALILFLVTACIGWRTRLSLIGATAIFAYLNVLDCISSITKYSVIATHGMLLLSLSDCGAIWSVDSWLKGDSRRKSPWPGDPPIERPKSPAWPRRLMQILIGTVYLGAAFTKMHTPAFFSGDQLQSWLITNYNFHNPVGEHLWPFPVLLVVFAYIAIVWEVLFIFLAWRGWGRVFMLGMGVIFHLMTTLTLGLYIFPMVSLSLYVAFLNEHDVQRFSRFARRLGRRWQWTRDWVFTSRTPGYRSRRLLPIPSPAVFAAVVALIVAGGVGLEYQLDPYGTRQAEGRLQLVELDNEYVRELLTPSERLRMKDKLQSFDVGTIFIAGVLTNRRTVFRRGELIAAQCYFPPPHEDMWIECHLHDADDGLVDSAGQVVARETFRSNFFFRLTVVHDPGDYYLVVKSRGQEISRRKITLQEDASSPVAN